MHKYSPLLGLIQTDLTVVHTQEMNTDTLTFMYILLNAMMYSDGFPENGLAFDRVFQKISFLIRWKK